MKIIKIIGLSALILSIPAYIYLFPLRGGVQVVFLDVGQGDASLIILPDGRKILVDGGPDDKLLPLLGQYFSFFDRRLDLVILSHEHDDHVFGLVEAVRRYQVENIIEAADQCGNPACRAFFAAAQERGVPVAELQSPTKISFGPSCILDLWPPDNPKAKNINDRSIALRLDCDGATLFMDGDGEHEREQELLASGVNLSALVFKASHHGSNTSNSLALLEAVKPAIVAVPVGVGNSFGHPSPEVIERLQRLGISVFRTGINGNISLKFWGKTYPQITIDKRATP